MKNGCLLETVVICLLLSRITSKCFEHAFQPFMYMFSKLLPIWVTNDNNAELQIPSYRQLSPVSSASGLTIISCTALIASGNACTSIIYACVLRLVLACEKVSG